MTDSTELDRLRAATPRCAGVALFSGAPLSLVASSGEPTLTGWSTWSAVAEHAPALLREGPVEASEVLMRLPGAMLLLAERAAGLVAVVVEVSGSGAGVALVQARVTASKVSG
jgi:hypothetical protein